MAILIFSLFDRKYKTRELPLYISFFKKKVDKIPNKLAFPFNDYTRDSLALSLALEEMKGE